MLAGLVKVQFNILVRVRACNKNIRPGKERSKEASRHVIWLRICLIRADQRSVWATQRLNASAHETFLAIYLKIVPILLFSAKICEEQQGFFSLRPVSPLSSVSPGSVTWPSFPRASLQTGEDGESGLDTAQTWPGHVTTTFVSAQTVARHQTVEKTGELWRAGGEMILHILSLVSTLCLLPSGWLKRSGLLGTPELPINILLAVFWLRWWKKGKCRYLDPIPFCRIIWLLLTAQLSAAEAKAEISPVPGSSCFTRQFNQFGWKWH